ncbi:Zinc finger CCCH domain-containing protein 20 [Platanthera zijinensis]|uniref:Zinc finger CCCH domain-containing protein 20 n=1 Tax=Platanthera zijinensis TaxID=2320716 RepID=A0AAP0BK11_9ASPA
MGEGAYRNTTIDVPPWSPFDDQTAAMGFQLSPTGEYLLNDAAMTALRRYLPANEAVLGDAEAEEEAELTDPPIDAYSCDEFRIYEFKVRRCARGRSHDWTECPYAHPGEKARRRDPRKYHYSGVACPDFRKGICKRGDACEFAHGVFECWLHPARYRTQPCKDGTACRRRVCFFAHTPEQLRLMPHQQQSPRSMDSYDGASVRLDGYFHKGLISSPRTSTMISPPMSPPIVSPPLSPSGGMGIRPMGSSSVNDVLTSLRRMQISKAKSTPNSWGGFGSPGLGFSSRFCSFPATPTSAPAAVDGGCLDLDGFPEMEEPAERVESGRALRAKMYERLSRETGLNRSDSGFAPSAGPDVGWISELIK